jgi:Transposase IS66 family
MQVLRVGRHRGECQAGKSAPPISPIALEAVKHVDALFDIERQANGLNAEERLGPRRKESAALVVELKGGMRAERAKLSRHAAVAEANDYMLTRWEPSPDSSMTAASVFRTTRSSARCAA